MFIVFEGIDGSGKTTQLDLLHAAIEQRGYEVLRVREPGGTAISESIRQILLHKEHSGMTGKAELLLFAAARAQLVDTVIRPALEEGRVVLCDRFIYSTLAYQGYGRGLLDEARQCTELATGGLKPDIAFLMRISPAAASQRIGSKDKDRMEEGGRHFFEAVAQGYENLLDSYPELVAIDATREADAIHKEIMEKIQTKLYQNT